MTSFAIVDSGPLIAAANPAEPRFEACVAALRRREFALVIPAFCLVEAAYLVSRMYGADAEAAFLTSHARSDIRLPSAAQIIRIAELVRRYADFPLGTVDASVVALAEELDTDVVITLDRRHFGAVRPRHCAGFTLLPE